MNLAEYEQQLAEQSQQLHRQYGVNALLPEIQWNQLFPNSKLSSTHLQALETIYQSAVPLALQVFEELNFDAFSPAAYKPQGLVCSRNLQIRNNNYSAFWSKKFKA